MKRESRMDDAHVQVRGERLQEGKLAPNASESERCDTNLGLSMLCRVLRSATEVEVIDNVQDCCPAWEKFRKHKDPQGYTLPCVLLRSQLMQRKR